MIFNIFFWFRSLTLILLSNALKFISKQIDQALVAEKHFKSIFNELNGLPHCSQRLTALLFLKVAVKYCGYISLRTGGLANISMHHLLVNQCCLQVAWYPHAQKGFTWPGIRLKIRFPKVTQTKVNFTHYLLIIFLYQTIPVISFTHYSPLPIFAHYSPQSIRSIPHSLFSSYFSP